MKNRLTRNPTKLIKYKRLKAFSYRCRHLNGIMYYHISGLNTYNILTFFKCSNTLVHKVFHYNCFIKMKNVNMLKRLYEK